MTSTQTGNLLSKAPDENGYGLGWSTTRKMRGEAGPVPVGECGHGGAYATQMWIDPGHDRVMVFMVQHAGFPGGAGGQIYPTFRKLTLEAFPP